MDAYTFERAAEIYDHRQLAAHEGGHAAAAMLLGLDVEQALAPFRSARDVAAADPSDSAGNVLIWRPSDDDRDGQRKMAIVVLAGQLAEGKALWPPQWPLSLAPDHGDEAALGELVKQLDLDSDGYNALVEDAYELTTSRPFARLHAAISHLLERHGRLDRIALQRVKAITTEGATVEHAIKSATVQATDRGEFTAIAAAYTVDRVKDQIIRGAFNATIERWRASGKRVPLHWDHRGEAANVIGLIDPAAMSETAEGLRVSGRLDIDSSDTAREAWRSMKNGTMSLSFGYITTKRRKRSDGINELQELDLFEISIVPHPANPDTRIVEMKSIDHAAGDDMHTIITKVFAKAESASIETLEQKSERIAREHAPIQITSFEC